MNKIKIILVEDHDLFREGVCALLSAEKNLEIKGVSSGNEVLSLVKEYEPNVVITDTVLPDYNGIELASRIKSTYSHIQVMIMSSNNFEKNIITAIKHGVNGYISKDISKNDLLNAIKIVAKGNAYFCNTIFKAISDHMNQAIKKTNEETDTAFLSEREKDILRLIGYGLTNTEIAENLYISIHTVASHRRNLLKKIDVKNTAGLVRYATKTGLLG